ncbi:MAG: hypothetical protein K1X79_03605 [Oligoflexia bacterium]|nr:hypothetical protein [Oligoflexia bacterium]
MAQAFTPGLACRISDVIRRVRELPVPGELTVQVGQEVQAHQVVARAFLPGELHIQRVAEKIGIEPHEVIAGLKVQAGQAVTVGQVLCEHVGLFGLFRSQFKSPVDGVVELITASSGHIGVRSAAKPIAIEAYVSGRVVEVSEGKSVTIETRAAFVQGIFGVGGERVGKLLVLDGDKLPQGTQLRGAVLVMRGAPSASFLVAAKEAGICGLVAGSVDDQVLASYLGYDVGIALTGDEDVPFTLIVSEGFGALEMSERVYALLKKFNGQSASINGATQVRAGAVRPEIVIPGSMQDSMAVEPSAAGLVLGAQVRLIRVPFFGQYGQVHELPHEAQRIDTGALARVLRVKLSSGEVVTVPRANVELV